MKLGLARTHASVQWIFLFLILRLKEESNVHMAANTVHCTPAKSQRESLGLGSYIVVSLPCFAVGC